MQKFIVRSVEDIQTLLPHIKSANILSYDIETTGLNVRKHAIIGFGVSNREFAAYIIMQEFSVERGLREVLSVTNVMPILELLTTKKLVTHNGSFDTRFTLHYTGVNLVNCIYADTMLLAHTLSENRFSYGLKNLAKEEFGDSVTDEQSDMFNSIKANGGTDKEYFKADSEIMAKYGLQDNILTFKLWQLLDSRLDGENLRKFFYEDEVMPLYTNVTIPMELKGVNVDVPYLQSTQTELQTLMQKLENEIQRDIAPLLTNFNTWFINKEYPYKLSGRFKELLGSFIAPKTWPRTKAGNLSLSLTDIARAKTLTAKELKVGSTRELLPENTDFELIVNGRKRCPPELVRKIQDTLMTEDGVVYPFNLQSRDHWKRLFFGTTTVESPLNETPLSRTDKGSPQVDDEFLESMALKYPWCAKLQKLNSLQKIKSTYVDRFLEKQENGVYYPQFFQHRTVTGRYGSDIQQLPRPKSVKDIPDDDVRKYTNRVRDFIIAGDGHLMAEADYASLEVVVFADDSNDESLLNIIRQDKDFYSQVAIDVHDLSSKYVSDKTAINFLKECEPELRQDAKIYGLGLRYNMQSFKLSKTLNVTQPAAEGIMRSYFNAYPGLKRRMDELKLQAKTLGYVKSKGGRIKRFPELKPVLAKYGDLVFNSLDLWKEYHEIPALYAQAKLDAKVANNTINAALNYPIQSYAASIVNRAAIAIMREFKAKNMSAYICMQVHDSIAARFTANEASNVKEIMQRLMETTTLLSVPLSAKPNVGYKYGDLK